MKLKQYHTIMQMMMTAGILLLQFTSCTNKDWDEHYSAPSYVNGNLLDALSKDPDYKIFTDFILQTKCDTILNKGNQYTVLALTNDALTGMNDMKMKDLTAMMRMHIVPSAIYTDRMNDLNTASVNGKMLKFRTEANRHTVNEIPIVESESVKTRNGVIHRIEKPVPVFPNLYDVIVSDPNLTLLRKFIDENILLIADSLNNILLGYDTLNLPIYQEPIHYIQYSEFLHTVRPEDEQVVSTAFFPSDDFVRQALDKMLAARSGRDDLIAPRLRYFNQDTIVAGRFFRSDKTFPGDTAVLLNKIYSHVFVRGGISSISGTQTFTNIMNDKLTVSSAQIKEGARKASNGYYYILDKVDVPDLFFRNEFWLTPAIKNPNGSYTANPAITFFNTANLESIVAQTYCYTRRYGLYNCRTTGGGVIFKWPFVTAGAYKVILSYFSHNQAGIFDVTYGNQLLEKDLVTAHYYNPRMLLNVVKELGTIHVASDGSVEIVFTCSNVLNNPSGQEDSFKIGVDYLLLQPVSD